jgi:protoporphyrinogen/coproporphyrinogen III oxidase
MQRRAAVVGAGPAGLAAAWELTAGGLLVDLYDREAVAGGMLRTELLEGARVDTGVQLVGSPHVAFMGLARQAGGEEMLRRSPGRDALWRRGRAQAITYGSISSMLGSGALPTTLKLKMGAKYLPYLRGPARELDVSDLAGSGGEKFDAETIGSWGRRELGDDFVELLVYPLLAAYYGALPEETGAGVYHALARVGMDVSVYAGSGGFGAVAGAMVQSLERRGCTFRGGTAVERVVAEGGGVEVAGASYDGAVLAVPANRAAALLSATGDLAEWLGAVRERSTFTVAYRLDRPFPGDYFGLSFPRTTSPGARIAAVCIQSRKLPGLVPAGSDALVVMPAPLAVAPLCAQPDDDIAGTLLQDLEGAVRGIARHVTSARVFRFPDAYTVFGPGHVRALQRFDAAWLPPGLVLAGDYLMAPSVEGAVRSGQRAARRLAEGLGNPSRA